MVTAWSLCRHVCLPWVNKDEKLRYVHNFPLGKSWFLNCVILKQPTYCYVFYVRFDIVCNSCKASKPHIDI